MPRNVIANSLSGLYAQVTRGGDYVYISGQVSVDEAGELVGLDDPQAQATQTIANLERYLEQADATFDDVVELVLYVTSDDVIEPLTMAVMKSFATPRPSLTLVKVSSLFDPRYLVEVKAVAYTGK